MSDQKILVVEDDQDQLRAMVVRLSAAGYDVVTASEGTQAAHALVNEKPHLLVLDLGLPGGDGYSVLEQLYSESTTASIPVIVVTARDPGTNVTKTFQAGASAYLQKPVDHNELLAAIRCALKEPHSVEEA